MYLDTNPLGTQCLEDVISTCQADREEMVCVANARWRRWRQLDRDILEQGTVARRERISLIDKEAELIQLAATKSGLDICHPVVPTQRVDVI